MSDRRTNPTSPAENQPSLPAIGFDAFYGLEILELGEEQASARLLVADHHKQPWGVVHGGVYASIAEAVASYATAVAVVPDGMVATGMANHTSFLRPISSGTVHATGSRKHRGRTSWVWEIELRDDEHHLCALSRVTIAVRKGPPPSLFPRAD